jgi:peptide/nickel transport system substrate-binding protein
MKMNEKVMKTLLVAAILLLAAGFAWTEGRAETDAAAAQVGELQRGGTLTVSTTHAQSADPPSWDPNQGGFGNSHAVMGQFLASLMTGDITKGQTGTKEHFFDSRWIARDYVRGNLAESWEVQQNPLRIVVKIRPGIYWNEVPGIMERRELTAEDVVFTWDRRYDSLDEGAKAAPKSWEWIKSYKATDKYTFVMDLNYLNPDWLGFISMYKGTLVVPHEVIEAGPEDWKNWVGVGTEAFKLKEYVPGSLILYEKNPDSRHTTVIDGQEYQTPFVDELVHTIIPDEATRVANLRTGALDILFRAGWAYKESLAKSAPDLNVYELPNWGYHEIAWRCDRPPFDDLRVRQALSMAVDRDFIVSDVFGGAGIRYNYPHPLAWGEAIQVPVPKQPKHIREVYEYDPVEAKKRLAEAGYPDGFKTTCLVRNVPLHIDLVSLVADYWEEVGVELELEVVDPAQIGARVNAREFTMAERQEDGPTPASSMYLFMKDEGYDANVWEDEIFIDLINRFSRSNDPDEQEELHRAMSKRVLEEVISLFLPAPNMFRYAWPWVQNYYGEANTDYVSAVSLFPVIWIDQAMKKQMGF